MTFVGRPYTLTAPESSNITRLVPFDRHLSAIRWQFIRGVLFGILASCAVAIPTFKYSNIRQHGASLHGARQTALENSDTKAASGALKSTSEPEHPSICYLQKRHIKPRTNFLTTREPSAKDRPKSPVPRCKSAGAANGPSLPGATAHKKDLDHTSATLGLCRSGKHQGGSGPC